MGSKPFACAGLVMSAAVGEIRSQKQGGLGGTADASSACGTTELRLLASDNTDG